MYKILSTLAGVYAQWTTPWTCIDYQLRLVFTSDGVVVGVVIRRVERYDLVKTKPTESEAEH